MKQPNFWRKSLALNGDAHIADDAVELFIILFTELNDLFTISFVYVQ